MSDYTLPPAPFRPDWAEAKEYGQQCAEAARAPLLARIAELEAAYRGLDAYKRALSSRVGELEAQLAQAQADAKRYRWLRDNDGDAWFDAYGVLGSALVSDLVDQAVDKAMKESGDA